MVPVADVTVRVSDARPHRRRKSVMFTATALEPLIVTEAGRTSATGCQQAFDLRVWNGDSFEFN